MTQTIEQLTARIAELEEENARLKAAVEYAETIRVENIAYFEKQLATSQLRETQLRKALEAVIKVHGYESGIPVEAISTQASTEALDAYVAEKVNKIESCRDWYKRRIDLLQEWQSKMRDPERTIVCDIIANGLTMPEGGRYEIGKSDLSTITKQRDLAVEALEKASDGIKAEISDNWTCNSYHPKLFAGEKAIDEALSAIKESEAK